MNFTRSFVLLLVAMAILASEEKPTILAQLIANKDSPTETDLVLIVGNSTKKKVSLTLSRYVDDRFEKLNLKVTGLDGNPVPLSNRAKELKARKARYSSDVCLNVTPGEDVKVEIDLSQYYILPAKGGYTVTGASQNLVWLAETPYPIDFITMKSSE